MKKLFYEYSHNFIIFQDKQFWKRYIYLWINYALFEELETEDIERCRQVYRYLIEENNN